MYVMVTDLAPMAIRRDPARPLFAIGDIHGYSDAFEALLKHLDRHISTTYPGREVDLVYLGDFVDRGPDPIGVLRMARRGLGRAEVREVALMGNHDLYLMGAAELAGRKPDVARWASWMINGGRETLTAAGENPLSPRATRIRASLGEEVCGFLADLRLSWRSGDIFCVHAGIDPARMLEEQIEWDLIWIREPFLSLAEDLEAPWTIGVTVVHGHSPHAFGAFANRIGVDNGGYKTGLFSAVEIWDGGYRFHTVDRGLKGSWTPQA